MIFWDEKTDHTGRVTDFDVSGLGFGVIMFGFIATLVGIVVLAIWSWVRFGPLPLLSAIGLLFLVACWTMYREYKVLSVRQKIGEAL